jgi:hypothetical protein
MSAFVKQPSEQTRAKAEYAIGPLGERITRDTLPPVGTIRWVARRKAEVVAAVRGGLLTVDEVCQRYNLTHEEFATWQHAVKRAGLKGLRTTRSQFYRELQEAERKWAEALPPSGARAQQQPDNTIEAVPDRRESARFALLLRLAKLITGNTEQFCIIRDASSSGLKVKLFTPLGPADDLQIELANGDRHRVRRVWDEGDCIGLRFVEPIALEQLMTPAQGGERRNHMRLRLALEGVLHLGGTVVPIDLHDISTHGAALRTDRWLLIDERIRIETRFFPVIDAKVRWRDHPHYGVVFDSTFPLPDLAVRCNRAQDDADGAASPRLLR